MMTSLCVFCFIGFMCFHRNINQNQKSWSNLKRLILIFSKTFWFKSKFSFFLISGQFVRLLSISTNLNTCNSVTHTERCRLSHDLLQRPKQSHENTSTQPLTGRAHGVKLWTLGLFAFCSTGGCVSVCPTSVSCCLCLSCSPSSVGNSILKNLCVSIFLPSG